MRELCTLYEYDCKDYEVHTLTNSKEEVAAKLRETVQTHVDFTGIHIIDARISELTYDPMIA